MKKTRETYEQGTGKLLSTEEIDVPDPVPTTEEEIKALKVRVANLEK